MTPMTKGIRNPNFDQAPLDIQPSSLFRHSGFVISHSVTPDLDGLRPISFAFLHSFVGISVPLAERETYHELQVVENIYGPQSAFDIIRQLSRGNASEDRADWLWQDGKGS